MRRLLAWALAFLALPVAAGAQPPAPLVAAALPGSGPIEAHEIFAAATPVVVPLIPQLMATPHAPSPSVTQVTVRALRNDDHVGFLLEWQDATADVRTALTGFGDMAAVAFPARSEGTPPAPFMGNPGGRVHPGCP